MLFGDGAFGLTGFDIETAGRFDLPFVGVGGNNTRPEDIRPAMERARGSATPSCVHVMLGPDVYSSGTMNQTIYK